jgi:thioester reductase-like protein
MSTYFITGATGVVGSAVVAALLAEPQARMRLLIRATSAAALSERVRDLLAFAGGDRDDAGQRVAGVRGDTTQPSFGLDEADYRALAEECTHVVHIAGLVRMNLPLDEARASAVTAMRNVLAFIHACERAGGFSKAELVSTVGVGGRWPGALPERFIDEPRTFHNTYEHAKAEAEALAAEAVANGARVTVHRPSMVVGDSRTGRVRSFQVFYHLAEFLSGRRTGGIHPPLDGATVDLVPADYVAKALVWSSAQPQTIGRVLHLASGPDGAVPLPALCTLVRDKFGRAGMTLPTIRTLGPGLLKGLARAASPLLPLAQRRALSTLPIFLDYLAERQLFDNSGTRALLHAAGIPLPGQRTFLDPVLDYYLAAKHVRETA